MSEHGIPNHYSIFPLLQQLKHRYREQIRMKILVLLSIKPDDNTWMQPECYNGTSPLSPPKYSCSRFGPGKIHCFTGWEAGAETCII